MIYRILFAFMVLSLPLAAQQTNVQVKHIKITDSWTVHPKKFKPDLNATLRHEEAPLPGGELSKEEARALKRRMSERYPRTEASSNERDGERSTDTVRVSTGFASSFFLTQSPMLGGTPNDNTLAISDGGNLITSWNSQLWAYDIEADTYLFAYPAKHPSFLQFLNTYNDTVFDLYFPFDPKLMYEPERDRFVLVFLTGRDPSNSATIVCFSSSSDPKDPWYAYRLPGNPLNYDTWTDYPQTAMNDHSFYLTLNQLYPDSGWVEGFAETVLWQMDLDEAFAGSGAVSTKFWTGFSYGGKNIRYLHPVKSHMGPEGDSMYFMANRPFVESNDTFFLLSVAGNATDTNTQVVVSLVPGDLRYGHPPYALQAGNQEFWTNDARILGAVRMGKEIHFTGNSIDTVSGKAAVYHGVIEDVDNPFINGKVITHPSKELGFPNIDFIGAQRSDRDVVIFANHTAVDIAAGNSVIYVDNLGNHGPVQNVKSGETYVDGLQSSDERWGDYTGIQRKYNEPGKVWVAGYWGYGNQRPGTWISEIEGPKYGPEGLLEKTENQSVKVFPNPAIEMLSFEFSSEETIQVKVLVRDVQGRVVARLGEGTFKPGINSLRFDVASLKPGYYSLEIIDGENRLFVEKFIKG